MVDKDSLLRYGAVSALIGLPIALQGLSNGDAPSVEAQSVSSKTAIELCGPTLWRADSIRTGYPFPLQGMRVGDNYTLREPLKKWDGFVIIGDRIVAGNINEQFTRVGDLKITIFYTDETDGNFAADFNAGNNIRYDFFDSDNNIKFDPLSLNKLAMEGIERGIRFQGGVNFVISRYNASTQETAVMYRFNTAQANDFVKKELEDEAKLCVTLSPTNSATNTTTSTSTVTSTLTPTATETATATAVKTSTASPTTRPNTPTPTATETATATAVKTSTASPTTRPNTPTPTVLRSPTPNNLNCGFKESVGGWKPDFRGGGDYPFGELNTFVPVTIRTRAFTTSGLIASYLAYKLEAAGQLYEIPLDGPNEIVIALFPGGGFGTNWEVLLRARENVQLQTEDPSFGETPLALDVMRAHLIWRAEIIKKQQFRTLERAKVVTFHPDGFVFPETWNAEDIASKVRYENCLFASVFPVGRINGW